MNISNLIVIPGPKGGLALPGRLGIRYPGLDEALSKANIRPYLLDSDRYGNIANFSGDAIFKLLPYLALPNNLDREEFSPSNIRLEWRGLYHWKVSIPRINEWINPEIQAQIAEKDTSPATCSDDILGVYEYDIKSPSQGNILFPDEKPEHVNLLQLRRKLKRYGMALRHRPQYYGCFEPRNTIVGVINGSERVINFDPPAELTEMGHGARLVIRPVK